MSRENDDKGLIEQFVSSREIFTGKMLRLSVDTVCLPDGQQATRELVRHPGAVVIVPVLPDGRIVFVRQYRYAVGRVLYELPAGKLDAGEQPDVCAGRELQEETGYIATDLQRLSSVLTVPGFCDEVIHVYRATGLTAAEKRLDADEFVEVVVFDYQQALDLVKDGVICDAKTLCALFLLDLQQ